MSLRKTHPNKHIEAAIAFAEATGWRFVPSEGHAFGRLLCPLNDPTCQGYRFCQFSVWSTPRVPEHEARKIRHHVSHCRHYDGGGTHD